MKKILLTALMALTLCVQHESHAMANLRNYAGRIGQQCARLYTQGAQQVAPAYRTLTTGARQQLSNLRPQTSRWYSTARNWSQNLNLPTARTTALGLGAGLTTAAYLQRPDIFGVVGAEEEVPTPKEIIKDVTTCMTTTPAGLEGPAGPIGVPSKAEQRNNILREMLYEYIMNHGPEVSGTFNIDTFKSVILDDILLANAARTYKDIQPDQNIELPTFYKEFFQKIGRDEDFGPALKNTINEIKKNEAYKNNPGLHRILDAISNEIQGTSSSWWSYFGY
jgi:hypothetical protein